MTPHPMVSTRIATPIHTARAIASRPMSRPSRARSHSSPMTPTAIIVARSSGLTNPVNCQPAMRGCRHGGDVVSDNDASERTEEHPLDQGRRSGESRGTRTEGAGHAADKTAGDEQRPAFNVDGPHECREDRRGEHEPDGGFAQRAACDTGDEECRYAKLRDRQRGRLAHRHERQERRRRQDDPNRMTGRDG